MTVKLVIDPGHGGRDPGAAANGLVEKNLVLTVGLRVRDILESEYEGIEIRMTRTTDVYPTLGARTRMARNWGANAFLSIHFNAATAAARGTETFMHRSSTASRGLRKSVHDAIFDFLRSKGRTTNRGEKTAGFFVLADTYTSMLSILTEPAFLTNTGDANFLKQPGSLEGIARGHAEGVASFYKLKRKSSAPRSPVSTPTVTRFVDFSNRDKYAEIAKAVNGNVKVLQELLNIAGYSIDTDGIPGPQTLDAIQKFQVREELSTPQGNFYGRPGPSTMEALEKIKEEKERNAGAFVNLPNRQKYEEISKAVDGKVKELQELLVGAGYRISTDGIPGPQTLDAIEKFQIREGISTGTGNFFGRPGGNTMRALREFNQPATPFSGLTNNQKYTEISKAVNGDVRGLQSLLRNAGYRISVDGIPGPQTLDAIQKFQIRHKLSTTGSAFYGRPGPSTMSKLRSI